MQWGSELIRSCINYEAVNLFYNSTRCMTFVLNFGMHLWNATWIHAWPFIQSLFDEMSIPIYPPILHQNCKAHYGEIRTLSVENLRARRALNTVQRCSIENQKGAKSLFKDVLLRTRRALSLFKDVLLRTRRALSLFKDVLEGRYLCSKMFYWEPEGRYHCSKSMAISLFWFSTECCWTALMPFWLFDNERATKH